MKKIKFPVDKKKWSPSLIPGAIVLITSINAENQINIAPKSWIQMVSFEPPVLMFSGTKGNTTENNILQNENFCVNFIDATISSKVFQCIKYKGKERIDFLEFSFSKSEMIDAPQIDQCKANIECKLYNTQKVGSGFVIFGEMVYASIWDELMRAERAKKYELLDQIVFLENSVYGKFNQIRVLDLK